MGSSATRASRFRRSTRSREESGSRSPRRSRRRSAPGLRIGYFVVPQPLVAAYDDRAVSTYISPSLLPQATVHELMHRGGFEPNLDARARTAQGPQGRDAGARSRRDAGRHALELAGGWVLPLAGLCRRRRCRRAADPGDRGRCDLCPRLGLLPERLRRAVVGPPGVQLRDRLRESPKASRSSRLCCRSAGPCRHRSTRCRGGVCGGPAGRRTAILPRSRGRSRAG